MYKKQSRTQGNFVCDDFKIILNEMIDFLNGKTRDHSQIGHMNAIVELSKGGGDLP